MKQQSETVRDLIEPGWREREAELLQRLKDAIPLRKPLCRIGERKEPCGECHLQPGERCDVCGARQSVNDH